MRKYNSSGTEVWTRQFGTDNVDEVTGIAANNSSVFIIGRTFGTFKDKSSKGGIDAFFQMYSSSGNAIKTDQFGTSEFDHASAITANSTGVYVTGYTLGGISWQSNAGGLDVFVRKYSLGGSAVWTRQLGSPVDDIALSISVDAFGESYVAGYTYGSLPGQTSAGLFDAFVHKYDSNGTELWTRQFGTDSYDFVGGISVHGSGVYVYGNWTGQTNLDVSKYDSDGIEVWTRQFGTTSGVQVVGISVNADGLYLGGGTSGTFPDQTGTGYGFLAKLDLNQTIPPPPVNTPPTVAVPVSNVAVLEDAANTVLDLSAVFADVDTDDVLTVTVTGNTNPGLLSASVVGTTLTLVYAADQNGTADITIRATDKAGAFIEDTFTVTVTKVNDAPTVAYPISNVLVSEDAVDIPLFVSAVFDDVDVADVLTLSLAGNTNPGLLSALLSTDSNGGIRLTLDFADNQHGTADITLRATDLEGAFIEDTFSVTVVAVNDQPTVVNPIPDLTVPEDSPNTVYDLSAVFTDVDIATDADYLTLSAHSLFGLVSTSMVGTTLTISYLPDQNGFVTIFVRATDSVGVYVEDSFMVTVLSAQEQNALIIQDVQDLVFSGDLLGSQGLSLTTKLELATDSLNQGNITAGINQLEAFINQVNAFISGGILSASDGQKLIDAVNDAIRSAKSTTGAGSVAAATQTSTSDEDTLDLDGDPFSTENLDGVYAESWESLEDDLLSV